MTDVDKKTSAAVEPSINTQKGSVNSDNYKEDVSEVRFNSGGTLKNEMADSKVFVIQESKSDVKKQGSSENKVYENDSKDEIVNKEAKVLEEEDVPENFFDDFMNEDFMEGLNVVDTWEGDDVIQSKLHLSKRDVANLEQISPEESPMNQKHNTNFLEKRKIKNKSRSSSRSRRRKLKKCQSKEGKYLESKKRRDPNKTQRDILKDKDKCEKDKTTKMIYEKLKVVETGLVPPGTEMEVEVQKNKLEDGEILSEHEVNGEKKITSKSKSNDNRKEQLKKTDQPKRSRSKGIANRTILRRYSPDFRRMRSRSRSLTRRHRSRNRSRSLDRRIERRRRSRTRSRSLDRRYRYRTPPRKTSPLVKRNKNLYKEIDILKAKLYSEMRKTPPHRNIEYELIQAAASNVVQHPLIEQPLNFNPMVYPPQPVPCPVPNPFIPIEPVPPPIQHMPMELDQQFFIGQPSMDVDPCGMQMQQPQVMQNPMMPPIIGPGGPIEMQPNFPLQNWPPMNQQLHLGPDFFNNQQNLSGNPEVQSFGEHFGFNPMNNMVPDQHQSPQFIPQQNSESVCQQPLINNKEFEEEIFAKLFMDNKITLSDYLSVTAKSTDNNNPIDIQNKIKVISHCQDALNEINGCSKTTGKFTLRKSQKSAIKVSTNEGLSPFKKIPVIKFQFTTCAKNTDDKPTITSSLNRLLFKIGMDAQFEEPPVLPTIRSDHKQESPMKIIPENEKIKSTVHMSTQTDTLEMIDFGVQVSFEDIPSPIKNILKKQSLAKLTPAQLLAQAEKESSPPPAPRWSSPERNRKSDMDSFRNFDNVVDIDARSRHTGFSQASQRLGRNPGNPTHLSFYNRSPDHIRQSFFGNRH